MSTNKPRKNGPFFSLFLGLRWELHLQEKKDPETDRKCKGQTAQSLSTGLRGGAQCGTRLDLLIVPHLEWFNSGMRSSLKVRLCHFFYSQPYSACLDTSSAESSFQSSCLSPQSHLSHLSAIPIAVLTFPSKTCSIR